MHRVFLPSLNNKSLDDVVVIDGDSAHHLYRVARVRADEEICVFFQGIQAIAQVHTIEQSRHECKITAKLTTTPNAGPQRDRANVILLQGYPKSDKLDGIVKSATELGVQAIWPVFTSRSVPIAQQQDTTKKRTERLQSIAISAAEQSGRADVPEIFPFLPLQDALARLPQTHTLRLVLWERAVTPITKIVREHFTRENTGCVVLVGPEGGLSESEVTLAQSMGFHSCSLGPRILRTETVAPAVIAILSSLVGDLSQHG